MKKIFLFFVLAFSFLFSFSFTEASIFTNSNSEIPYCKDGDKCGLVEGVEYIKDSGIEGVVVEGTASQYIQKGLVYLLTFLKLVAVLMIIYSGLLMLTAQGDEEKFKKGKTMIIFSIIGLAIIYLAGPITTFIIDIFK